MEKLNAGEKTVLDILKSRAVNDKVSLHTVDVERNLIHSGKYSLCVSRYIRSLKRKGYIFYLDPRAHSHIYNIIIYWELR